MYTVSFTITVAGSVESFDASAFKAKLAGQLEGVSPADIALNVTMASVRVAAIIRTRSEAIADASLQQLHTLTKSVDVLSDTLGVVVEAVAAPPQKAHVQHMSSGETSSSVGLIAGLSASVAVLLVLVVVLVGLRMRRKRLEAHRQSATATPIGLDVHPQAATEPAAVELSDRKRSSAGVAVGLAGEAI